MWTRAGPRMGNSSSNNANIAANADSDKMAYMVTDDDDEENLSKSTRPTMIQRKAATQWDPPTSNSSFDVFNVSSGSENGDEGDANPVTPFKTWRGCADSLEEESNEYLLADGGEVPFVRLWGWTNSIYINFPNLKANLKMNTFGEGKSLEELYEIQERSDTMERIARKAVPYYRKISIITGQVVAKIKSEVFFMKKEPRPVGVIANFLIGDESGVNLVSMFNELVERIHSSIQVGDFLAIEYDVQFRRATDDWIDGDKSKTNPLRDSFCGAEIKLPLYSVRKIKHVPFRIWKQKLPANMFPPTENLQTPTEITSMLENKNSKPTYVDVFGVILYVGRIERHLKEESVLKTKKRLLENTTEEVEVNLYLAYRWIEIIDTETTRPLQIKIIISAENLQMQNRITPGAPIVLTYCEIREDYLHLTSSIYTQIYLYSDIQEYYCEMMPDRYAKKAWQTMNRESYKAILARKDVTFGIGGTIHNHMASTPLKQYKKHMELMNNFQESRRFLFHFRVPENYKLVRRESFNVNFRGKILLVQQFLEKDNANHSYYVSEKPGYQLTTNKFIMGNPDEVHEQLQLDASKFEFQNPSLCLCNECMSKQWFHYQRKVEMPTMPKVPNTKVAKEWELAITRHFSDLCGPLGLPSIYSPMQTEVPLIANLPLRQPFDCYRLTILDTDTGIYYQPIWRGYSLKEMKNKLETAFGKVIIGSLDIFKSENFAYKEVVLEDFIIEEEAEELIYQEIIVQSGQDGETTMEMDEPLFDNISI